jgi:CHAT domain-containing protein
MLMLRWAERWRATIFAHSPVRSNEDANLVRELAQLRLARRRVDEATRDGEPTRNHEREVQRLESDVRAVTLRASATTAVSTQRVDIATIIEALDDRRLVEICPFDDALHVLVVSKSGVCHYVAGSHQSAVRTTDYARFALRRTTHRSAAQRARATLPRIAASLEAEVFGSAVAELGDGPLVLVPPAALSSAPWGVLPSLRSRDFTVAPSAASWFTAAHTKTDLTARTVLLAGPGLRGASVEINALAQLHPQADVLGSPDRPAFAAAALTAMDGASLAHIAAHGTFRDDNPMFSSLVLEDGPLTVFDLQQLRRAPHRLVLSCCDAGTVSAAGADEMLGLLTALTPLGTAGMIAAVVPVSDAAGVDFATIVHRTLLSGATSGRALQAARIAAQHDPAAFAIAHAFIAFGAA